MRNPDRKYVRTPHSSYTTNMHGDPCHKTLASPTIALRAQRVRRAADPCPRTTMLRRIESESFVSSPYQDCSDDSTAKSKSIYPVRLQNRTVTNIEAEVEEPASV